MRKPFQENDIFDRLARHLGVRFIYADEDPPARAAPSGIDQPALGPGLTAAALPAAWLNELRQATVTADLDQMLALIEQLRPDHPVLAEQLAGWAGRFEYDHILSFVRQGGEKQL
jgi:hypothetical protein